MPGADNASAMACAASSSSIPSTRTSSTMGNFTVPAAVTLTVEWNSGVWNSLMSSKSPGEIGAAIGAEDKLAAPGNPAEFAPAPVQAGGASFAFGVLLLSLPGGMRATPVGSPEVLGVGACPRAA